MSFAEREEWRALLREVQAEDVFFSPEYLKCNEILYNGQAECFVYQGPEALIIYPYIICPIEGTNYFDITSAYGFGGFIGWPRYKELDNFRKLFREYCHKRGIVSEFIRFHPFYGNHQISTDETENVTFLQNVVYSRTDISEDEIKRSINKEAWKKIRKAMRNELKLIHSLDDYYYEEFINIYYETMIRLNAAKFYLFSRDFFVMLKLLNHRSLQLFLASYGDEIIGGLLVVSSEDFSYNFLSGSKTCYNFQGVNDFLQYNALSWAGQTGKKKHMLGGGLKGEDSLFKFKAKFSPLRLSYYIGRYIYLPDAYEKLCNEYYSSISHSPLTVDHNWFPVYRIPKLYNKQVNNDI